MFLQRSPICLVLQYLCLADAIGRLEQVDNSSIVSGSLSGLGFVYLKIWSPLFIE